MPMALPFDVAAQRDLDLLLISHWHMEKHREKEGSGTVDVGSLSKKKQIRILMSFVKVAFCYQGCSQMGSLSFVDNFT